MCGVGGVFVLYGCGYVVVWEFGVSWLNSVLISVRVVYCCCMMIGGRSFNLFLKYGDWYVFIGWRWIVCFRGD